jgi:hypothetical protein
VFICIRIEIYSTGALEFALRPFGIFLTNHFIVIDWYRVRITRVADITLIFDLSSGLVFRLVVYLYIGYSIGD